MCRRDARRRCATCIRNGYEKSAPGSVCERRNARPRPPFVCRQGEAQVLAAAHRVVERNEQAAISQSKRVEAGIRIGQVYWLRTRPRQTCIFGPRDGHRFRAPSSRSTASARRASSGFERRLVTVPARAHPAFGGLDFSGRLPQPQHLGERADQARDRSARPTRHRRARRARSSPAR